ncbi:PDZ domain-containing protein [Yinghuangia aomiensis]
MRNLADQMIKDGKVTNSGPRRPRRHRADGRRGQGSGAGVGVVSVDPEQRRGEGRDPPNDVITAVNGTDTPTASDLATALAGLKPGDVAQVTVMHPDGSQATVSVTLGELS